MDLGNHGNWFVLSMYKLSEFLWGLIDFPEARELPTQQLSLFVKTSAHLARRCQWMFIPCCWGNDAVASVRREASWQLPLHIHGEDPVRKAAWHHMYDLMHSPLLRETVGLRWCYRCWRPPVWPHTVSSGASATYFGGHVKSIMSCRLVGKTSFGVW